MLKIEKYKKEIKNFDSGRENIGCYLVHLLNINNHDNYRDYCYNTGCSNCFKNSLLVLMEEDQESIKLTRFEYKYLKHAKKNGMNYIARDFVTGLHLYSGEPSKGNVEWEFDRACLGAFGNLFDFIKWEDEEPYSIDDILEKCVVIDDE